LHVVFAEVRVRGGGDGGRGRVESEDVGCGFKF